MTDYLPTVAAMKAAPASPLVQQAAEVVIELRAQGLSLSEIGRLANLPGRTLTFRNLEAGTCGQIRAETVDALLSGYEKYLTGDRSYRKLRGTRPKGETSDVLPAMPSQPMLRVPGSRLWDRVAAKRKEAA